MCTIAFQWYTLIYLIMKKSYNLYKIIRPKHLQGTESDGYYLKILERHVLEYITCGYKKRS